jgi:hypothetical protein
LNKVNSIDLTSVGGRGLLVSRQPFSIEEIGASDQYFDHTRVIAPHELRYCGPFGFDRKEGWRRRTADGNWHTFLGLLSDLRHLQHASREEFHASHTRPSRPNEDRRRDSTGDRCRHAPQRTGNARKKPKSQILGADII